MASTVLGAFAVSLTVAIVTASLLGDLCFDVCQETEQQELACRKDCYPNGWNDPNVSPACVEPCVQIGAPCRTFCVGNFSVCKQQCNQTNAGDYNCLVTCLQQRFAAEQNSTRI